MIGVTATSTGGELATAYLKLRTGDYRDRVAKRSATRMQGLASEYAPVDTGSLSISIAIQTHDEDDYGARAEAAREVNPKAEILPEPAPPTEVGHAVVLCVVGHGVPVNGGTIHRAAEPFWDRAAVETEAQFQADAEAEWQR